MTINKETNGSEVIISLEGKLDTVTAPDLEKEIDSCEGSVTDLTLDLEKIDYVSSAGLRVILKAQKMMNKQGSLKLTNVCDDVMEIFDITGFIDILTIE